MKNKKWIIIIISLLILVLVLVFLGIKFFTKDESDELKEINKVLKGNFAMYIQSDDGSYEEVTSWPSDSYKLNDTKTVCLNNSGEKMSDSITYKNGRIEFTTSSAVYCYLYFDIIPPTPLDDVRYIKDCINNNSVNFNKEWVEIQAYKDGENVALNKTVTGSGNGDTSYVVDGVTTISETRLNSISTETQNSSYDSEIGGYNKIKRLNFNVSDILLGDKLLFRFDTYSVNIDSIEFNDYAANSWDSLMNGVFSYSVQHDKTGLHVVDINDPINYYVSGYMTVTSDMITDGTSNYSQMRFFDIKGVNLSSASVNYVIKNPNYYFDYDKGSSCVNVDLGSTYDLDEVKVWHYYNDGRSYSNHTLSVSTDNSSWTKVIDNESGVVETSAGKSYSVTREE